MSNLKRVVFVCQANAVRSPMAEGWGRELGDGLIVASSAGVYAREGGGVHPLASEVMRQAGIDISAHSSRQLTDLILSQTDYLIFCADHLASMVSNIPDRIIVQDWAILNPDELVNAACTQEEAYTQCRDEIRWKVEELLKEIG